MAVFLHVRRRLAWLVGVFAVCLGSMVWLQWRGQRGASEWGHPQEALSSMPSRSPDHASGPEKLETAGRDRSLSELASLFSEENDDRLVTRYDHRLSRIDLTDFPRELS